MKILSHKLLTQIPSASGMEMLNNNIYVCGDDSDFLFQISEDGEVLNKFPLFENAREGRVAKLIKYDFEAMVSYQNEIWLFGSGSLDNRNVLLIFNTDTKQSVLHSLAEFYAAIQREFQIRKEDFNIEGAAIYKTDLFLLNRGDNSIFQILLTDFLAGNHLNTIKRFTFDLPSIEGFPAGFSAACVLNDDLYFAASVEKTTDWINDGEILGSFIGKINLCDLDERLFESYLLEGKFKIEAISVDESGENIFALTDNDGKPSEMLQVKLIF